MITLTSCEFLLRTGVQRLYRAMLPDLFAILTLIYLLYLCEHKSGLI